MAISVANFSELKQAIEDSTTTEIIVTANITFASGGAKVNVAKSNLVVDFGGYTVIDNNNQSFTDTIYVPSTNNTLSVTLKNAVWSGRNYYGVLGVYDNNKNVSIFLDNINYTGPQFVYNKYGTTSISDCTIVLDKNGSAANPQEFCEANRLIISGITNVTSGSTSNAVIWFTGIDASLTVSENSVFNVNALSTYFLYTDISPVMLFKQKSETTITTKGGLFYAASSSSHIASSFTLEDSASFIAYQKQTGSAPMFKCLSRFTVGNGSTFQLFSEPASTTSLCYFGQVANININSPKSIVLYNNGGNVFSFQTGSTASPNTINITGEMIRVWNTATIPLTNAGGIDDSPTQEFHKDNYTLTTTLSVKATNSQVINVESNITETDVGYPLNATTLNLLNSKVVSVGNLDLSVDTITDLSTQITGKTFADANVRIIYDEKTLNGVSDSSGEFAVSVTSKVPVDTMVSVLANKQFITKSIEVKSEGSVSVLSSDELKFYTFVSPTKVNVIYRQNSDYAVQIIDTRTFGDAWYLYAYILNPLTSDSNTLQDAIIFRQNGLDTILSKIPLLVYTGQWLRPNQTTNVSWTELEGFLLNLETEKEYVAGNYSTNLMWEVTTEKL